MKSVIKTQYIYNLSQIILSDTMKQLDGSCVTSNDNWPSRCAVDKVSSHLLAESRGDSGVCSACNGYYGQAHGRPVCLTCHAFLYASGLDAENVNLQLMSEERDDENDSDRDSGNEEPNEIFYAAAAAGNVSGASDTIDSSLSSQRGNNKVLSVNEHLISKYFRS